MGLVITTVTYGTNYGGATYSPSSFSQSIQRNFSHHWTYDSYTVYTYPRWNSTHRNGVLNWTSQGYRYTQDQRDLNNNLTALIYFGTNFPNPKWDLDDDNGDGKKEEAEVTADSASFPTADYGYSYWQRWSRSVYLCQNAVCKWYYDPSSGSVGHSSQISKWQIEWNTHRYTNPYAWSSYPYQSNTGVIASAASLDIEAVGDEPVDATQEPEVAHEHEETAPQEAPEPVEVAGVSVYLAADGHDTNAVIDTSLPGYIEDAQTRSNVAASAVKNAEVTVTFVRPLDGRLVLDLLGHRGITTHMLEAIGTLPDGHTLTIGAAPELLDEMELEFDAAGAEYLGVVAASVTLADPGAYRVLSRTPDVLLADLTADTVRQELAMRPQLIDGMPSAVDVILNDVYWTHAGLER